VAAFERDFQYNGALPWAIKASPRLDMSTSAFKSKAHKVEFVKDGVAGTLPSAMNRPAGSSIEYVLSCERKRIKKTV
jgi:hypothetical protein